MSFVQTRRQQVASALASALSSAMAGGDLPSVELPAFVVEEPPAPTFGDWSSNLAMVLAKPCRMAPRAVAEALISHLPPLEDLERTAVAGPGFINFFLRLGWRSPILPEVLAAGDTYGHQAPGEKRVLVEFVSANPTGPLNVVNCRAAAYGDALVRCLRASGVAAESEFYVNDAGGQFRRLGQSMEAHLRHRRGETATVQIPEGGYPGEYLVPLAEAFVREHGFDVLQQPEAQRTEQLARFAVDRILEEQKGVLGEFRVRFDHFALESEIRRRGGPEEVVAELSRRAHTEERDGALWLLCKEAGDNDDRVLRKRDGEFTYRVPDIAYHAGKFDRGYDLLIDIYGPDHHGEVPAVRIALEWLGYPVERMEVLFTQIVRLLRNGQEVKVSKRGGTFVAMKDFIDDAGVDAARYFFLMRTIDAHMDFDLDLARAQTQDNPVYYVQYAHARIAGILRQAEGAVPPPEALEGVTLTHPAEVALLGALGRFPDEVLEAAISRAPHRLTTFARETAERFHVFYVQCRVLGQPREVTSARLGLCAATAQVLRSTLDLLGVSAPERM